MVSKHPKNPPPIPNARLSDPELYFWIFALYFSGYNAKGISQHLALPRQTVNRNLNKIRYAFSSSQRFLEILTDEGIKSRFHATQAYSWFIHGTKHQSALDKPKSAHKFFSCYKHCPRLLLSKEFQKSFLGYEIDTENLPFST